MTDRTAVPERVSQRAKTARRGAGSGTQAVGDYVGQPAGQAAQAVRRAGLRPGLDRSFGCPTHLIGLVVAQDPAGGSELARNGMVTLYVAAPGGEPTNSDGNADPVPSRERSDGLTVEAAIEQEPSTRPATLARARRRKPGHARWSNAPGENRPSPKAIEPAQEDASTREMVGPETRACVGDVGVPKGALEDGLAEELNEREFPHEDFVVHVEDLLAGRSGLPGCRHPYPTRRLGERERLRTWVGEHRMVAFVVGFALVLWMVVGVASTLDGHRGRASQGDTGASRRFASAEQPRVPLKPTTAKTLSAHKNLARRARTRPRSREHQGTPRRQAARTRRRARSTSTAVSESVARARTTAPAPEPTSRPSAARVAPEQSGGGLFSP